MKFYMEDTLSFFRIVTSHMPVLELGSILETLRNKRKIVSANFSLDGSHLSEQEYVDSLNDIALFIDELINNGLHSNLGRISITVNRYDNELINVFAQFSRLITESQISTLNYNTKIYFNTREPNDVEFEKQEISKLSSNFLCSQTNIIKLIIRDAQLPNAYCLGHFKDLTINFSGVDIEELGPFMENFCNMLNYNQNIESLKIGGLPVGYINQILEELSSNDSLKIFSMLGNSEDHKTSESIANMIANNKSITNLHMYVPYEYEPMIEALTYNETLRKLILETGEFKDENRSASFLSDLDKVLDTNFALTDIEFDSFYQRGNQNIIEQIRQKLHRNEEHLNHSRFAKIKPIF